MKLALCQIWPIEFCAKLVAKARSQLDFIVFGRGVAWGWVARRRYGGLQRAARDISCVLLLLPSRPFSGDRRLQNTRASTQKGVSLARSPAKERPRRRLCGAVCLGRCDTSSCQCQRAPDRQRRTHIYVHMYRFLQTSEQARRPSANYG